MMEPPADRVLYNARIIHPDDKASEGRDIMADSFHELVWEVVTAFSEGKNDYLDIGAPFDPADHIAMVTRQTRLCFNLEYQYVDVRDCLIDAINKDRDDYIAEERSYMASRDLDAVRMVA